MNRHLSNNQLVGAVQKKRENKKMNYAKEEKRPFAECVLLEMQENDFLRDFFTILDRHVKTIRNISVVGDVRQARKIYETVQKIARARQDIVRRLNDIGITVEENYIGSFVDFGNIIGGDFGYESKEFPKAYRFNGIDLKKEMLLNPNDSTYKDKYEEEKLKNIDRAKRLEELKKEYRKKKALRFLSDVDREELKGMKLQIQSLQRVSGEEQYYERDERRFRELSDGTKKAILQYFEATEAIEKGADALKDIEKGLEAKRPPIDSVEVLDEAFSRMQANGMIEEDVERVMEILDEVAEKRKHGFYDRKGKVYRKQRDVEGLFSKAIYGFDEEKEKSMLKEDNILGLE